jgi:hypothetical protein
MLNLCDLKNSASSAQKAEVEPHASRTDDPELPDAAIGPTGRDPNRTESATVVTAKKAIGLFLVKEIILGRVTGRR